METVTTYYATLGVTPNAELPVIRAAYKALALSHHPDKTVHLSAEDRSAHSALFREIQEAFDILGNPSLKIAYDRELQRHGGRVDVKSSTFHRPSAPSRRRNTIRITSPEEKRALKAKIEQDLAFLREQRAKRDIEDSQMDICGLKFVLQTWTEMAAEYDSDTLSHGYLRAHCAVQMQVYQAKIAKREREHEDWLEGMSRPKTPGNPGFTPTRPPPSRSTTSTPSRLRTATTPSKPTTGTNPKDFAAAARSVPPTRAEEKARKEAAKQSQLDAKAAAVRAGKEKYQAQLEEQASQESARKASARAKAGAPALGKWGAGGQANANHTPPHTTREGSGAAKPSYNKPCSTCGQAHASLAEIRKCVKKHADQVKDESFFQTI
ncbi:uncharacterized protein N0V89_005633 [Didymosphaeria variabile]|uniref:J domain-containing protein n=1 Tax=Didymosphaeria variabile TaxID=1932322 RepID=A0A9W9CBD8_9PLEO|nr:uncharacterized protein N0V89_005633 [Didymosphaeria variabile]KAJ4353902.1 hypothetical protein N0V89_005633 [Didymosphaeria variabile]